MAAKGVAQAAIARKIGIAFTTVRKHYPDELARRRQIHLEKLAQTFVSIRSETEARDRSSEQLVATVAKLGKKSRVRAVKQERLLQLQRKGEHTEELARELMNLKVQMRQLRARRKLLAAKLKKISRRNFF
jgi:hypothetical protein